MAFLTRWCVWPFVVPSLPRQMLYGVAPGALGFRVSGFRALFFPFCWFLFWLLLLRLLVALSSPSSLFSFSLFVFLKFSWFCLLLVYFFLGSEYQLPGFGKKSRAESEALLS